MHSTQIRIDRRRFASIRRKAAYRAVVAAWDAPVIVACSGGTDSMALLAVAAIARDARRVAPFVAVQLDHGVRPESHREGSVVASVCRAMDVPFVQLTLGRSTAIESQGLEADLRALRYGAFASCAARLGLQEVVTAHTRNDQIETILLRLLSGSGSIANAGMRPARTINTTAGPVTVLRPLLSVTRAELEEILEILAITHVEDPTNEDISYRRNRLRQRVIPELKGLDPGFGDGLIRAVEHARLDAEALDHLARAELTHSIGRPGTGVRVVPRKLVRCVDEAIATRIVRAAILELTPADNREVTRERIAAVVAAASGRTGSRIEIPYGVVARVERDRIVIARECDIEQT